MNTGENTQGLRKIMDFTRLISIILLLIHFYLSCYLTFRTSGLTANIADRIADNLDKLLIFRSPVLSKSACLAMLMISMIGVKGKKDQKLRTKTGLTYLAVGLILYWITLLLLPNSSQGVVPDVVYMAITSLGYIMVLSGAVLLTRVLKSSLSKDVFNTVNETFPQEERLLENEYSINLPAEYNLKGKIRKSFINYINPFRALLVTGSPGSRRG
jgi:hypothetical protein